ncbi:hypothetical protein ACJDU8_21550 [Clostridium sp. WILCCON 0269]|uniref:Uncharacterized protein n=1 Tax=Candidatus Clostridium eludens TaxID=3381663 RepID=A0ABW8SSF9_9CLOT
MNKISLSNELKRTKNQVKKSISTLEEANKLYVNKSHKDVKALEDGLSRVGKSLVTSLVLYERVSSYVEFALLMGIPYKRIASIVKTKKKSTFLELIFYYGVEIRDDKEFAPGVDAPFYTALYHYYLKRFKEDSGVREDLLKNIDTVLPEHRGMKFILKTIDSNK